MTAAALPAVDEGQKPNLAEPFEQVLDVGVGEAQAGLAVLGPQFRRAQGEHLGVPGLVEQVAGIGRGPFGRGRQPSRRLKVQHAAVFGQGKAVEFAGSVARNPPDDRIHDPGEKGAHDVSPCFDPTLVREDRRLSYLIRRAQ